MKRPIPVLLALLLVTPLLGGCNKVRARVEMKKGNEMYLNESYREALAQYRKGLELDPNATFAWRSVGLSALALYRPGERTRDNRELGNLAIEAFENYLADYPEDDKIREYLLATYINQEKYDEALAYLERQAQAHPDDPQIQASRVKLLIQADRMDQAIALARQMPAGDLKAETLHSLAAQSWSKSYHEGETMPREERLAMVEKALENVDQALKLRNNEYFEAMVYYNLLLREKAKLALDEAEKQQYLDQANEWVEKAKALRKRQQEEEKKKQEQAAEQAKTAET